MITNITGENDSISFCDTVAATIYPFVNDTYSGSVDEGPINRPFGIATDDDGNVYVADTFNNRVLKYAYMP